MIGGQLVQGGKPPPGGSSWAWRGEHRRNRDTNPKRNHLGQVIVFMGGNGVLVGTCDRESLIKGKKIHAISW